jgi:hypothetical protein
MPISLVQCGVLFDNWTESCPPAVWMRRQIRKGVEGLKAHEWMEMFVEPPADAVIGERVMIEGFDGEPATENQVIKKKMLDVISPDLKTNGEGVATYKGKPFGTSVGPCKAQRMVWRMQM